MSRVAYVNGAFLPLAQAGVSVEDRGFLFADAVYEVWGVRAGQLWDEDGHLARLWRSLRELEIQTPIEERPLRLLLREVLRRNRVRDGLIYLQISRGAAPRDFPFPDPVVPATLFVTARPLDLRAQARRAEIGVKVSLQADIRWGRCDIKSTALLANVLAKQAAKRAGGTEALLVDRQGLITEGASSSAWIVTAEGLLITRDLRANILPGVTRATLLEVAAAQGLGLEQRAFAVAEATGAREVFLTSASVGVMPVVAIDSARIGDGRPGPIAQALRAAYLQGACRRT